MKSKMYNYKLALLLGSLSFSIVGQAQIEEIIVTAQKKQESLQDVPLAVSAYTSQTLEELGIGSVQELTNFSPSLRYENGRNARDSKVSIRGLGSDGFNTGIDPSVGFYLDGVYLPRPGGLLTQLADVQAIEVLKGPQGTLYGANTPAGVVNVNTGAPSQEFQGKISGGMGNYGVRKLSGFVSSGLTDQVSGRVSFWSYQDDGFVDLVDDQGSDMRVRDTFNNRTEFGARAKFLWEVSDSLDFEFAVDYSKADANCCGLEWIYISDRALEQFDVFAEGLNIDRDASFPSRGGGYNGMGEELDHVSYSDGTNSEVFEQMGASVRVNADIFDDHTLDVIAAYRQWDTQQNSGVDAVGVNISSFAQPEIIDTMSLEARIASPSDQFMEYLVGTFFYYQDTDFFQTSRLELPGCMFIPFTNGLVDGGSISDDVEGRSLCLGNNRSDFYQQQAESIAVFADFTFNLTDDLDFIIGGRVTRDSKDATKDVRLFNASSEQRAEDFINNVGRSCGFCTFGDNGGGLISGYGFLFGTIPFEDEVSNTEITWSTTLRYFPSEDVMVYGRAAKGYKAPGINGRAVRNDTTPRTFDEETSLNIEAGIKSTLLDNRLSLNATLFWTEFDDLQQQAANPVPDASGVFGRTVVNAGTLISQGVEVEYIYQATDALKVFGAVTYLDSEYDEFGGAPCESVSEFNPVPANPDVPPFCDQTGFSPADTPELRANATVQLLLPIADSDLGWTLQASMIYTDDLVRAVDQDVRARQDAYTLYDLSVSLGSLQGDWSVTAYVENATDEVYIQSTTDTFTSVLGFNDSLRGTLGAPRTFGLRAARSF